MKFAEENGKDNWQGQGKALMCRAVVAVEVGDPDYVVAYQAIWVTFSHSSLLKSEKASCRSALELE